MGAPKIWAKNLFEVKLGGGGVIELKEEKGPTVKGGRRRFYAWEVQVAHFTTQWFLFSSVGKGGSA